jgi:cephalosporin hydroxylase
MNTLSALRDRARKIRNRVNRRIAHSEADEARIVEDFHRLYYEGAAESTWQNTFYMGHRILKCPLDLWQYQEILHATRPDLIIETGTCFGGSALYLAHLCDLLGTGRVITIDIDARDGRPAHPRVEYWTASSVAPDTVERARAAAVRASRTMVILDSDHSERHVSAELAAFADLVTPGCYLIVEDTNVYGHPVALEHGPGPMEALDAFLATRQDFVIDERWQKFLMTFNPRGLLRRV